MVVNSGGDAAIGLGGCTAWPGGTACDHLWRGDNNNGPWAVLATCRGAAGDSRSVTTIHNVEYGYRIHAGTSKTAASIRTWPSESVMLTNDNSIVQLGHLPYTSGM